MPKKNFRKGPKWRVNKQNKHPLIIKHTKYINNEVIKEIKEVPTSNISSKVYDYLCSKINSFNKALIIHIAFIISYSYLITKILYDAINNEGFSFYRLSFTQASGVFVAICFFITVISLISFIVLYFINRKNIKDINLSKFYLNFGQNLSFSLIVSFLFALLVTISNVGIINGMILILIILTLFISNAIIGIDNKLKSYDQNLLNMLIMIMVIFALIALFINLFGNNITHLFTI